MQVSFVGSTIAINCALLLIESAPLAALRCFCNEHRCRGEECDEGACLVGVRKNGAVVRTCGRLSNTYDALPYCSRGEQHWYEVCSCTQDFCNSFVFFRQYILATVGVDKESSKGGVAKIARPAETIVQTSAGKHSSRLIGRTAAGKRLPSTQQYTAATLCFIFILIMTPTLITAAVLWFAFYAYC